MTTRVCVCTSYPAHAEPRGPRHAVAIAEVPGFQVAFIDAIPDGHEAVEVVELTRVSGIERKTIRFPHRHSRPVKLLGQRLLRSFSRGLHAATGYVSCAGLNPAMSQLRAILQQARPDIVYAHNIDTLLPAWEYTQASQATLIFDSMEFHSGMGSGQSRLESSLVRSIEAKCLPACKFITTSGPLIAEALSATYGTNRYIALYNMPRTLDCLPPRKARGLALYWRNSTIGLGQRGLQDAIQAVAMLPPDVTLSLQGRLGFDGGAAVRQLCEELGVTDRVNFLHPCKPSEAVLAASRFHVGLCLEHSNVVNHNLTVSNKLFDYHMASMAVVASDLPPFRPVLAASGGGIMFEAGNAEDLARVLADLYENPERVKELGERAREYALRVGNLETEMNVLKKEIQQVAASSDLPAERK